MSFYLPPWNDKLEPNQTSVRQWLDNLYSKFQPVEQARWNQSNIDTLFYAGAQTFVNRYFGMGPQASYQNFYFNLLQQPINMVTGYQRQHRKAINCIAGAGGDEQTADQFTKLITTVCNQSSIYEDFSKACELSAITGFTLVQPYLDFNGADPAQGDLKLKTWEYNSFLVDPYFRSSDMSDANFVWCQEYISKREAESRFPEATDTIAPMMASPQRHGNFYFLPENQNLYQNDLMVLSYVWYKWKRKKKKIYSPSRQQFFDFGGSDENLSSLMMQIPDLEEVEIEVPSWKIALILNDRLIHQGYNPLGFDECPFVPIFWNYEPHNNYYDLRCRGLVRTMRDSNYLLNRRIILNHDISEATINAGWKRKIGAVANEETLKKTGQGWDVIINDGYELTDCEKIIPSAVPESDMALADQLQSLIFSTSGVNLENWSAQDMSQASSLTVILKQAANLMVLQKYFDQWDFSLKTIGKRFIDMVQNNWNENKVRLIIGEEPSVFFYSKLFSQYQVVVEEGLLTPTQKYQEYQQWLELNQQLGGIIPPTELAKRAPIQGKNELVAILEEQQKQQQAIQQEAMGIQHAVEAAKLKELYSKVAANLSMAKERQARSDSNIGLLEERLSEISKNQSLSIEAKTKALTAMLEAVEKYGEIETRLKMHEIERLDDQETFEEDMERVKVKHESSANDFMSQLMSQETGPMQAPQEDQHQIVPNQM